MSSAPQTPSQQRENEAVAAALLAHMRADLGRGELREVAHYQRRFAGFEELVAAEYAAVRGGGSPRSGGGGEHCGDDGLLPVGQRIGPYRIEGFLGRGGQARVYSAFDERLKRTIALKVLAGVGDHSLERRARFRREAEIGARLDHPGICPVFEAGSEGPWSYLALKLVRGRTLAELLEERSSGQDRRAELLGQLYLVAQAVAYAHARGVIHRDLKPSNVMVGEFGETLVMDWGLAKILDGEGAKAEVADATPSALGDEGSAGAFSVQGYVFGTRGYMAPEQARGEVQLADRRADVFSLGAMLCEVLTGKSAEPERSEEVVDRLERCGVSRELIELATDCLRSEPDARPADAGEVARRLGEYTRSAAERARRAELDAVEVRTRAAQERRVRRRTLAIAAALVVVAALLVWIQLEHDRRALDTLRAAQGHIEEARRLEAIALVADDQEVERWQGAVDAAQRAFDVARAGEGDEDLLRRTAALLERVRNGEDSAREARRDLERRAAIRDRLAALRSARGVHFDDLKSDRDYGELFATLGIDSEIADEQACSEAFDAFGDDEVLLVALDDWIRIRRRVARTWRPLAEFAQEKDAEEPRRQIRASLWESDLDNLVAIAAREEAARMPSGTVECLTSVLVDSGRQREAIELLLRAWRRSPGDFYLNSLLAYAYGGLGEAEAARRYYTAAAAAAPESSVAQVNLAASLYDLGEFQEAMHAASRAVTLDAGSAIAHNWVSVLRQEVGDREGAITAARRAVDCDPKWVKARNNLGIALFFAGRHEEAGVEFREVLRLDPEHVEASFGLSQVLTRAGQLREALEASARAIEFSATRAAPGVARWRMLLDHAKLLARLGRFREARDWFERAHEVTEVGSSARKDCESLLAMTAAAIATEERVDAVLSGDLSPADEAEWLELLAHCAKYGSRVHEAELWLDSLARFPALAVRENGFARAARAAAVVALGRANDGEDLGEDERAAWSARARAWLEAELAALRDRLAVDPAGVRSVLAELGRDEDFQALQTASLAPNAAEGRLWKELWEEFGALERKASG